MPELTAEAAIRQLKSNGPAPVYAVVGEEEMLQQRFIAALRQALWPGGESPTLHQHRFSGDEHSVAELVALAATPGFFDRRRLIIAADHPVLAGEQDPEPLLAYLAQPNAEASLVLQHHGKLDGRRRLTRALKQHAVVVACEVPKGRNLEAWIRDRFSSLGKEAEPAAVARLAVAFPAGLHLLASELEKVATLTGGRAQVTVDDVDRVLAGPTGTNVFDMVDAMGERRVGDAVRHLDDLLAAGEAPLKILYMVSRQIRLIWQALALRERGLGRQAIQKELGQHPFVTGKILGQTQYFAERDLARAMEQLLQADLAMKRSGQPEAGVLETLVINLAGGAAVQAGDGASAGATRRQPADKPS